jgi:hypothetical protein
VNLVMKFQVRKSEEFLDQLSHCELFKGGPCTVVLVISQNIIITIIITVIMETTLPYLLVASEFTIFENIIRTYTIDE